MSNLSKFRIIGSSTARLRPLRLLPITSLLMASLAVAQTNTYYRVVNDNGNIELKSTLSAAEAKRGYAIVSLGGNVIKEVPAELTDEEYAKLSDELRLREQKEAEEKANREYNESLMLKYSNLDDIEAERSRKLAEFDVRVSILRSNMMSLKDQVERQQARAADIERGGREVPEVIRNNILELEEKLSEAEGSLITMQDERVVVEDRYAKDLERFTQLMGDRKKAAEARRQEAQNKRPY